MEAGGKDTWGDPGGAGEAAVLKRWMFGTAALSWAGEAPRGLLEVVMG